MKYRRFGKTGLQVSTFSLGTMRYLASQETATAIIQQALTLGINHIETARGYGKSEQFLGHALREIGLPRTEILITTKIPPTPDAATMERAIEESLEHLQTPYLDCLAIHGLNTSEHLTWIQAQSGCMAAVQQAVSRGLVRHVGFSTHGSQALIQAAISTDLFEFVNLHYYYFFQRHAPVVELAAVKDMGILIISPADKGGMLYTPSTLLQELCHPFSPLELNYRFLLSDPRISTLSIGPAKVEELAPVKVGDRIDSLTELERAAFDRLQIHQESTLATDHCSQCYACLPCPEDIQIPEVLRLRNLAVAFEMTEYGRYRYGMFENAGHWFPGRRGDRCTECGDCLPRCPQALNIPALLKDTHHRLAGKSGRRLWE